MDATLNESERSSLGGACPVLDATAGDTVDGVPPGLVARPRSTPEVAELMRAAAARSLSVVTRGRGTKLTWGLPPTTADVLLDLSDLDQVLEHAAGDLIAATQAGTSLASLQEVVGHGGQRLALDETVRGASIGGTLATNASGSRRMSLGSARDLLIGVTVVRADGVVAKAGGKVVKNVAGYDLGKLMIGSLGTLAVITEAVFRLHPLPESQQWITAEVADPAEAAALTHLVVHSQVVPAAVDLEWTAGRGALHVLLEGREDGVSGRAAVVRDLLGAGSVGSTQQPPGTSYPWDPTASDDGRATALKLTFRLSGLRDVLAVVDRTGVSMHGSVGTGVAYASIAPGTPVDHVRASVTQLRATCTGLGGAAVILDAPAAVKSGVDVWGAVPAIDLMHRVKNQFDPEHRLSPGRFVGGI